MAGNAPPLVIPVKLDGSEALKQLQKLDEAGKKTGDEIAGGAKRAEDAHVDLASSIRKTNIEMWALNTAKEMLNQISQAAIESANDIKRMAEEFINLRDRSRELAGILNRPGNVQFTQEQLHFGTQAGFAQPQEAVAYRAAFRGEAQQYADRFKTPEEFAEFEKQAAQFGNRYGVDPTVMAKVAGTIIRTGPQQGVTSQAAMQTLGGALGTQMAGSGQISELAGQLARMSGQVGPGRAFKDITEAAVSTRMAAETNLPEASTWATEMRMGVVELATGEKKEEKAKELGITPETTNFEAIKKLSQAQEKSGQNMDVFLAGVFPQIRIRNAFRDSITAYRNGVMEKGLKDATAVMAGQTETENKAYLTDVTQAGALNVAKAETEEEKGKLAQSRVLIAPYLQRAKTELMEFETSQAGKFFDAMGRNIGMPIYGALGHPDVYRQGYGQFEQVETARAMNMIKREAQGAGVSTAGAPNVLTAPQRQVEDWMAKMVVLTKEANDQRAALAKHPLTPVANPVQPTARP
jgi:hypothetical protein